MHGLGKQFRIKILSKNSKNSKDQSEIAACEQKITSEKANFCSNTFFSLYFKIIEFQSKFYYSTRVTEFHAAKPLAYSLHLLFRRDQNHYSNLTSKIMKMCEEILRTAPQYNSKSLNCKKTKRRPKIASAIASRLLIHKTGPQNSWLMAAIKHERTLAPTVI